MNLDEIFTIKDSNNVELKTIDDAWNRAKSIETTKAQNVTFTPTRRSNGDGTTYPVFNKTTVLPSVKAFGATPVNVGGIYPAGTTSGTAPQNSVSAQAGTYTNAKFYGKATTKRKAEKLWGRYVPVEYITFSTGPYLDLAPLTTESEIEIKFRKTATSTSFLFGTNPTGSQSGTVGAWVNSTSLVVQNGNVRRTITIDTDWHTLKVTSTKTYLDDTEYDAGARSDYQNLVIGSARDQSSGVVETRGFKGDISYVKVGSVDFIPVKDVVNNVYGMWDRVNEVFYGNSGTGSFTGGEEIKRVEYLETSGSQYILPGFTGNVRWKIVAQGTKKNSQQVLLSSSQTAADATWLGEIGSTGKWGIGDNVAGVIDVDTKATIDISFSNSGATGTINGFGIANTTAANHNVWAIGATSTGDYGFTGKIYSAQAIIGDASHDYVPCKIGTTGYMLDTISWTLFANAGTGSFTLGNEIPNSLIVPEILETSTGDLVFGQYGKNLFDKSLYDGHGWYLASGKIADTNTANATVVMRAIPNKTYYFKHCSVTGGSRVMYTTEENWDIGSTAVWLIQNPTAVRSNVVSSFTVPSDAKWIFLLAGRKESGSATLQEQVDDYMLSEEVLTADTPYEPYQFGLRTSGQQVVSIGSQTYNNKNIIPSATSYIDLATQKIGKDWAVKVLDGTESWTDASTADKNIFHTPISGRTTNIKSGFCSHFEYSTATSSQALNGTMFYYSTINTGFRYDGVTLSEFKAYLAEQYANGTPLIVVYPLATPTEETDTTLPVFTQNIGTSVVDNTNAYNAKLNVEVKGVNIQVDTPSPTTPLPIKVAKGELKYGQYGKNLAKGSFYTINVTSSKAYSPVELQGDTWITDGRQRGVAKIIEVEEGKQYTVSMKNTSVIGTKVYSQYASLEDMTDHTKCLSTSSWIVSGAKYALIGFWGYPTPEAGQTIVMEEFQIELGSTPTPYEPYHFGLHGDGQHKVVMSSQGVVDLGTLTWNKHSTHGIWYVSSISDAQRTNGITNLLMVGTNYSLIDVQSISAMEDMTYKGHPNDRTFYVRDDNAYDNMTVAEFKASLSGKYLFYQRNTDATFIAPQVKDVQSILASDTSYEDMQTGEVHKDWAIKVLDGTEAWDKNATQNYYRIMPSSIGAKPNVAMLCSHFNFGNISVVGNFNNGETFINFHPDVSTASTTAEFKSWLASEYAAGNPVMIVYPLATATTETVTVTAFGIDEKNIQHNVVSSAELSTTNQVTYKGK